MTLEATADIAGIRWLHDAPNPAEAIGRILQIHLPDGHTWFAAELGKPTVTLHTGYPHPAPVPLAHAGPELAPEFYTVTWHWRPSAAQLRVQLAQGNEATALLWTVPSGSDTPAPAWQMLLAGEVSNPVELPFTPKPLQWNWKARLATVVAACGLGVQAFLIFVRLRRIRRISDLKQ
ncbi:MAG: hypothetical protein DVB28_000599 [Verrucomicrobia bacterium]|nr:MAG: hypothetical protein DVB28_000599 [Verrucomicrobiota bacterium]